MDRISKSKKDWSKGVNPSHRPYSYDYPSQVNPRHGTQLFRHCYFALILRWCFKFLFQRACEVPRPYFIFYPSSMFIPRKHPRNERVTSAEELDTMSKITLDGLPWEYNLYGRVTLSHLHPLLLKVISAILWHSLNVGKQKSVLNQEQLNLYSQLSGWEIWIAYARSYQS